MKLAFCLFKYFPYGGLQRDFLRIARVCRDRGHDIHIYTSAWEGDLEPHFVLHLLPARGLQNHARNEAFAEQLAVALKKDAPDLVIGFNKMPHLDVYYAADVCYQARAHLERGRLYRLLPRYHHMIAFEKAVFARGRTTNILLISPLQEQAYRSCYDTEEERFHLLPPGISRDRVATTNASTIRKTMREAYHIPADHHLLLMVGSGFQTKGVDRAIHALASLNATLRERCHLLVIGEGKSTRLKRLAQKKGVSDQVVFLGGRPDVPNFLVAADVLVHPAYHENTGTVLLEAMVAGLPVLTTEVCGYAHYVRSANVGMVVPLPFSQTTFNQALETMLLSPNKQQWHDNGVAFAKTADIYHLPEKAADVIEALGQRYDALSAS